MGKSKKKLKPKSTREQTKLSKVSKPKSSVKCKSLRKIRKNYSRSQVEDALADIATGMSTKKAAAKWGVPRTTLTDLKKGTYGPDSRPGPSPVLTEDEENLLCEWITELSRRGIPLNRDCLLDSVQKILNDLPERQTPFTDNRPGAAWFSAFLRRHPNISQRHAESISRSRGAVTEESIRGWFSDLAKLVGERITSDGQRSSPAAVREPATSSADKDVVVAGSCGSTGRLGITSDGQRSLLAAVRDAPAAVREQATSSADKDVVVAGSCGSTGRLITTSDGQLSSVRRPAWTSVDKDGLAACRASGRSIT